MKKKTYFQLALLFILINSFIIINATAVEYTLDIDENTNWIWQVDEYDEETYEDIFIEDADFDEDDQQQIKITEIDNRESKWIISYDRWDYTDDTNDFSDNPDDDKIKTVYKDPEDEADDILDLEDIAGMWIVPSPYVNYIEEFRDEFDNPIIDVSVEDDKLIAKYAIETAKYEIEIEYGDDGLAEEIEYLDEDGDTFVKITLIRETVPGFSVALVLILIFGVIGIIIWRKRSYFQNN
jgi:hypothetical protein